MYDPWKSVGSLNSTRFNLRTGLRLGQIALHTTQCATRYGTHRRRRGIYILRPYLYKRRPSSALAHCSGTLYRYTLSTLYCESWCGGWVGALQLYTVLYWNSPTRCTRRGRFIMCR